MTKYPVYIIYMLAKVAIVGYSSSRAAAGLQRHICNRIITFMAEEQT